MKATVLLAISDQLARANTKHALSRDGFQVIESTDAHSISEHLRGQFVRLVIIGMHEPIALELCRTIRRDGDVPVMIMLPAPNEPAEWMSFQAGADDVISITTSKRVLISRVDALVKQHPLQLVEHPRTLQVGPLMLDLDARTLEVDGAAVVVTRIEFDLLAQLMAQPRRVHIRADLIQSVWGAHYPDQIVETHLSRLRKKIRLAGGPDVGAAVRGIGYRLGVDAQPDALVS